jgi:two-component system, sensor histidine kinase
LEPETKRRVLIFVLATFVAASIFIVDVVYHWEQFGGLHYFAVVLLAWWSPKRSDVWPLAGLAAVLTITAYLLSATDAPEWVGLWDRVATVFAIAAVSGLIFHGKGEAERLRQSEELRGLNRDLQMEIASRKEAEVVLRESEERYRLLVEQSPEGVIVHDGIKHVFANRAALKMFGASGLDEMLATDPMDLIRDQDKSEILERRRRVMQEGQVFATSDAVHKKIDGTEFFAERYAAAVLWNGCPAVQLVFRDITQRKQTEMALREAKESAERANASKSRFLAAASHDLRQPIQALNLFVHSLSRKTEGNAEIEELVQHIRMSSEVMSDLLNALLDISKLDAGMINPEIDDFPAEALLDDVSNTFLEHAREKGVEFRVLKSSAIVRSDPTLVRRIINNYVSNAIRYTRSGRVLLGCRRNGNKLRIEVWDTGPGIPASEQAHIFEEFYQLENPARDRSHGLGLGLAIVKRTADLLGLEFGLRSVPGMGSMFWVATPLSLGGCATEPCEVAPGAEPVDIGNIVLIEDDAIVLRGLQEVLVGAGYQVVAADTAPHALARLRDASISPDLIIADHRLGAEATGIDAIDLLQGEFGADVSAIIITGDTAPDRLREAAEGGHILLHKPVLPESLLRIVAQAMPRREHAALSG